MLFIYNLNRVVQKKFRDRGCTKVVPIAETKIQLVIT